MKLFSKPSYGKWQTLHQCHNCGLLSDYSHKVSPCETCGEQCYDSHVMRYVAYSRIGKLYAWLTRKPVPQNRWDYKSSKPPIPRNNQYVPQARIDQLKLQQELVMLLPDDFDVFLEEDKVYVKRIRPPAARR